MPRGFSPGRRSNVVAFVAPQGGGPPPVVIPDALVDYNYDDVSGADMDPISLCPDSSGNGYDMTASLLQRPTLILNDINGHKAGRYDGVLNVMTLAYFSGLDITNGTFFIVIDFTATQAVPNTNAPFLFKNGSTTGDASPWAAFAARNVNYPGDYALDMLSLSDHFALGVYPAQGLGWKLFTYSSDGANWTIEVNGVTAGGGGLGNFPTSTGDLQMGGYTASFGTQEYSKGDFARVALSNPALDDTTRATVNAALMTAYGL